MEFPGGEGKEGGGKGECNAAAVKEKPVSHESEADEG